MRIVFGFILVWIICSSIHYEPHHRGVFGVRISFGSNSEITSFVCYLHNGRTLTNKRIVDKETFIKIVSGYWPSPYNPKQKNIFKEQNLDCDAIVNSETLETFPYCIPLDSLWKIRFSVYPYREKAEYGWSNKLFKPSSKQEKYIFNRYGVRQIDGDYFMDTSLWLLLHDVLDTNWISNYKSLK